MITIKEAKPIKASGLSSLHVSFDFNMEVVDILKQASRYFYDKKTHCWELPCDCLAYLLDSLTYIDDITLELLPEVAAGELIKPQLVDSYKVPPFPHQLEAITFGLQPGHEQFLLLDEPGLGKTASVIHLAEELKAQQNLEHCLIICGINALKGNWESEIKKHSNLSCRIIGKKINSKGKISYSSVKERSSELYQPLDAFFYIINVESLRSDDIIQALRTSKNNIGMVVVDEVHKCKSSQSQQGHGLLKLTDYKYKIGLTGTLIESKPLDAYAALRWLGVEKANLTTFKSQYCIYGGFGGHQIIGYRNLPMLKEEIDSCSIRRTKSAVKDLPPKIVMTEMIEMNDAHRKFYEDIKAGIKESCTKIELNTQNTLALTTRLMEATSCPSMLTDASISSSKLDRVEELVQEIVEHKNKVVIMSTFKEPLLELYDRLQTYNPLLYIGGMSDDECERNRELFQKDSKYKVWLGTASKSGTGLTLNAASYMICINTPWNASTQRQIEDRIHRIDNTETAFIYKLICENTIDERVEEIIERKQAMGDFLIDGQEDPKTISILRSYIEDL